MQKGYCRDDHCSRCSVFIFLWWYVISSWSVPCRILKFILLFWCDLEFFTKWYCVLFYGWICTSYKDLDTSILCPPGCLDALMKFLMILAESRGPAAQARVIVGRPQKNVESSAGQALYTPYMALIVVAIMAYVICKCK